MYLDRRQLILGASAAATLGFASSAQALDVAALNTPPALGDMSLGPDNAKVTVIEYASATCPHCANFYKTVFPDLKKEYIDTNKIRFVFREWPHENTAVYAFMVARCAPKDKYFPLIDMFFTQQDTWLQQPREGLQQIAQLAGMTKDTFEKCLTNKELGNEIIAIRNKAEAEFGVEGVPTFFINGEPLRGETSIEEFRKRIDPLL
jgi:protein-disulfide isomerase